MMRKLEKLIGEDLFREGMQEYLQTYSFGNATWPALVDILDGKSDEDLHAWSQAWVNSPGREPVQAQWDTAAEGEGGPLRYGLVPAMFNELNQWDSLGETERAALLINLYEQMLAGNGPRPGLYLDQLTLIAEKEKNHGYKAADRKLTNPGKTMTAGTASGKPGPEHGNDATDKGNNTPFKRI